MLLFPKMNSKIYGAESSGGPTQKQYLNGLFVKQCSANERAFLDSMRHSVGCESAPLEFGFDNFALDGHRRQFLRGEWID
jgi:hypothetical protein